MYRTVKKQYTILLAHTCILKLGGWQTDMFPPHAFFVVWCSDHSRLSTLYPQLFCVLCSNFSQPLSVPKLHMTNRQFISWSAYKGSKHSPLSEVVFA